MAGAMLASECKIGVPMLENGAHLDAEEFLRRYEAMLEIKKAELVDGIVNIGSPVSLRHAEPDSVIQGWLFYYSANTPGTRPAANATVRLGAKDVPQPDALLRIMPECGGLGRLDERGYLEGPPELAVEIAASSVSIDAHEKLNSYRRSGVVEYLLWRTEDQVVQWWAF